MRRFHQTVRSRSSGASGRCPGGLCGQDAVRPYRGRRSTSGDGGKLSALPSDANDHGSYILPHLTRAGRWLEYKIKELLQVVNHAYYTADYVNYAKPGK